MDLLERDFKLQMVILLSRSNVGRSARANTSGELRIRKKKTKTERKKNKTKDNMSNKLNQE